jgi:hypothetical protein
MERVPYGPKTNGNLIRCHLQGFDKKPRGFEKVDPGAATHTGPAATVAILPPVETAAPVLTAVCGGGRFLPPFETAAGTETAVRGYFRQR